MPSDGFGTRLRHLRQQHGLSQVRLAKSLRVTKLSVWNWERRGVTPLQTTVRALADIFGVSEHYLLTGSEDGKSGCLAPLNDGKLAATDLELLVADCKRKIAMHLGTTPDRIGITFQSVVL